MRILVTGATGLVGAQLMADLRERGADVTGTSRSGSRDGVVEAWDLAGGPPPRTLRGPWDVVVNNAADISWTMPPEDARRANVRTLDGLAEVVSARTRVVQVSTAYAIGRDGTTDSPDPADYRNTYEWSKAEGERHAAERFGDLVVVRPSLIHGRRHDGHAARFAGIYVLLRGISSSTIPAVPAARDGIVDVVPVDDVTRVLADVATADLTPEGVLTVAGGAGAPPVGDVIRTLVGSLNTWRAERGLEPFGVLKLVEPDAWERFFLAFAREHLSPRQLRALDLMRAYEPYLQITEPRPATHVVGDVLPTLGVSVRRWADTFPRLAAMPPRPWRAREETGA